MDIETYFKLGETIFSNGILDYYHKIGLSDEECIVFLQLQAFKQKGNLFPLPEELAQKTGKAVEVIYRILNQLQEKKIICLETMTNKDNVKYDQYNLMGFFEQLTQFLEQKQKQTHHVKQKEQIQHLYATFEREFSRPLSPFEVEDIVQWLEEDQYSPEIILLALKEAVLNQAYNFRYIDRILLNWKKKKIETKQDVLNEQKKRKRALEEKQEPSKEEFPSITFVPWLKKEDE